MKKKTCKILLIVGIVLILISALIGFLFVYYIYDNNLAKGDSLSEGYGFYVEGLTFSRALMGIGIGIISNPLGWAGIVLVIISLVKWNSEKRNEIKGNNLTQKQ